MDAWLSVTLCFLLKYGQPHPISNSSKDFIHVHHDFSNFQKYQLTIPTFNIEGLSSLAVLNVEVEHRKMHMVFQLRLKAESIFSRPKSGLI